MKKSKIFSNENKQGYHQHHLESKERLSQKDIEEDPIDDDMDDFQEKEIEKLKRE